jgi:hypothetical protein
MLQTTFAEALQRNGGRSVVFKEKTAHVNRTHL